MVSRFAVRSSLACAALVTGAALSAGAVQESPFPASGGPNGPCGYYPKERRVQLAQFGQQGFGQQGARWPGLLQR